MKKYICPNATKCNPSKTIGYPVCVHSTPHVKNDSCHHDKSQPIDCPWCRPEKGAEG